ncbi:MAG: hypothetical protein Q8Q31_04565 [Nanoarchaeota archaeon]|nr:hypothetical protein [Nanoarchaeota archaeon]
MGKTTWNTVNKFLSVGLIASALLGSIKIAGKKTDLLDSAPLQVKALDNTGNELVYNVPTYNSFKIPPYNCSRYARMAAQDVFGVNYSPGNAWDLKYENDVISEVEGGNLEKFAETRVLEPGMIVGIFNPQSKYLQEPDKNGNPRKYTHIALYLGQDPEGKPLLVHQYGSNIRVETYDSLRKKGLEAREILAPRKNSL